MFVFGREEEWGTKTVYGIGAQTVHVVLCVGLCWCVSDCIRTANGAMFLCDIAHAVYYVQRQTDISVGGINSDRSVVTQSSVCTA